MTENFDLDTGKNIVEALKQQSGEAFEESAELFEEELSTSADEEISTMDYNTEENEMVEEMGKQEKLGTFDSNMKPADEGFAQNMFDAPEQQHAVVEKYANDLYNFEVPNNVAVLKKLIAKLPSGVTRQTGAQIIKQTMEALGISMKSVLQEAQQLQDQLNSSAKECQATIQEYKRQIATLEEQSTSYKKQYSNLNELVSLFIQVEN